MSKVIIPMLRNRWDPIVAQPVPTINLDRATTFGELLVVSTDQEPSDALEAAVDFIKSDVMTNDDLILCTGDIAVLTQLVAQQMIRWGAAKLLRWDKNRKAYLTVKLDLL